MTDPRSNLHRTVPVGLSIILVVIAAALFAAKAGSPFAATYGAVDLEHYLAATARWLETGTPYLASEVAAPFLHQPLTFLHPPISLYLFAPFLVLPAWLWWAIPVAAVVASVTTLRPARWAWPLLALALCSPRLHGALIVGNTDLWVAAGLALGLRFGWPALLIVIKPSLGWFALVGAWDRHWWTGVIVIGFAALPLGALWLDWIAVVRNAPSDFAYSLPSLTWLFAIPLAWASRTRVSVGFALPSVRIRRPATRRIES